MAKKLILYLILGRFGPNLGPKNILWILPLLDVRHCCKLWLYSISKKTNEPNLRKWQKKPSLGSHFCPFDRNSGRFFFPKNLAPSLTRYHGQLSSSTISEKTNDPNLRKLSDRRTDGQTNKSDFIGCCPTNVERRKIKIGKVYIFTFKVLKLVAPMWLADISSRQCV